MGFFKGCFDIATSVIKVVSTIGKRKRDVAGTEETGEEGGVRKRPTPQRLFAGLPAMEQSPAGTSHKQWHGKQMQQQGRSAQRQQLWAASAGPTPMPAQEQQQHDAASPDPFSSAARPPYPFRDFMAPGSARVGRGSRLAPHGASRGVPRLAEMRPSRRPLAAAEDLQVTYVEGGGWGALLPLPLPRVFVCVGALSGTHATCALRSVRHQRPVAPACLIFPGARAAETRRQPAHEAGACRGDPLQQ